MTSTIPIDRGAWLGYRWRRHGLDGGSRKDTLDDLLKLGIQDNRQAGSIRSLSQRANRIGRTGLAHAITPDGPLVTLWSVRGAPHAHRIEHLNFVRDAFAPQPSDDGGAEYVEAVQEVAEAMATVVTRPRSKGEVSTEISQLVRPPLVAWCDRCAASHVGDGLFRAAGRHAQLVLATDTTGATLLHPPPPHRQINLDDAPLAVAQAFFRVNGPTTRPLYRHWSEASTETTSHLWSQLGELVRVEVSDQRYDLPESLLDEVRDAQNPDGVALVPPNDAYLRQVDRTLLVPDKTRRSEVWRSLSAPGALLLDGEVAGTWRHRTADNELTIDPFGRPTRTQRAEAEVRAHTMADAIGADEPRVIWK